MEKIIERVKSILLSPKDALTAIKSEEVSIASFMKEYVAILAAIPAVSIFIGWALVGHSVFGRRSFIGTLFYAALFYILSLVSVFVYSKVIDALAPSFNATKNDLNAFKLTVYAWTPAFVAGIFHIVPGLQVLAMLGALYGIYILYLGLPILMESSEEKTVPYTVVGLLVALLTMVLIWFIAGAIALGGAAPVYF